MRTNIYLDNAATTKTAPEVVAAMLPYFTENYGNPSALYEIAGRSKEAIGRARKQIADVIGAKDAEDAKDASAAPSTQPEPKTVEAKPVVEAVVQTAPPAQPEPKAVEAMPAEEAVAVDESKEKTFWELYEALSADQKAYFDGLRNAVQAKVGVRETEYPDQLGYTVFRSNLMRIRIRKETVEAVFMLTDPAFKPLQSGVVRIINASYYRLALETLDKKYAALLEQKKERENQMRMKRSKIEDQNVPKENTSI